MRLGILLLLAPLAVTRAEEGPVAVEFTLQERTGFAHHEKREWDQAIAAGATCATSNATRTSTR